MLNRHSYVVIAQGELQAQVPGQVENAAPGKLQKELLT